MAKLSQEKAERAIAFVLRYGAMGSTVIMGLGLGLMLMRGRTVPLGAYHRIRVAELFAGLTRGDPAALTESGILLLLLTPVFRIVVAVVTFALERDLKYVLISLGVLAAVLLSISFAIET